MRRLLVLAVLLPIIFGGSLRAEQDTGDVLNFADVASRHFHALRVERSFGATSDAPLVLHVQIGGDAPGADLGAGRAWLEEHLGVRVVERSGGLPVYLTNRDLVGSKGNDALGATIPGGIVVETRAPSLLGCAFAHEVGHALGLKHAPDRADIMASRCDFDKLDWATASASEREHVASIERIEAFSLGRSDVWAERA